MALTIPSAMTCDHRHKDLQLAAGRPIDNRAAGCLC
jgi:hypothetical protein